MLKLVKGTCPFCKKETRVYVDEQEYNLWLKGVPMEEAMPHLNDVIKETLISGICGTCQNEVFCEDDEPFVAFDCDPLDHFEDYDEPFEDFEDLIEDIERLEEENFEMEPIDYGFQKRMEKLMRMREQ